MKLPTLYGYASNGSEKQWSIEVKDDKFIVEHGKVGGKLQTKETVVKGKNIGRANETTPQEQAKKEAKAKWKKQLDKGYAEVLEDAGKLLLPMLAHDFRKRGHNIKYPAAVQPKLDGVRCLIHIKDGKMCFVSRGGTLYPNIKQIEDTLTPLFMDYPDTILDGELYIHGESLQTIVSAVKKPNEDTKRIEFWCFDLVEEHLSFPHRMWVIGDYLDKYSEACIVQVGYTYVKDEEHLYETHDNYVEQGYEGIMVRNVEGTYIIGKRSADLQKFKKFMDKEFKIIGHSVDKDGCIIWKVRVKDGIECDVTPKDSKDNRKALVKDAEKYYNKNLKVKFQAYTDDGNLQFPVGIELDRTDV